MKKILLGVAVTAMIAGTSHADSGAYVGFGLGKAYANMSNKTNAGARDIFLNEVEGRGFGDRKLKDDAFAGKLFVGYEYEMSAVSLLFEGGYIIDTSEAKHGSEKNSDKNLLLENIEDAEGDDPIITSMKLKRNRTFSLGFGVKKGVTKTVSMMAGLDLLHTQFQFQSKATATYNPAVNGVTRKKSKYGLAPWVGMSWDTGVVEAGLRYQYAKYQKLQTGGDFSSNNFSISNKIKPEYHTIMLTVSKKF